MTVLQYCRLTDLRHDGLTVILCFYTSARRYYEKQILSLLKICRIVHLLWFIDSPSVGYRIYCIHNNRRRAIRFFAFSIQFAPRDLAVALCRHIGDEWRSRRRKNLSRCRLVRRSRFATPLHLKVRACRTPATNTGAILRATAAERVIDSDARIQSRATIAYNAFISTPAI